MTLLQRQKATIRAAGLELVPKRPAKRRKLWAVQDIETQLYRTGAHVESDRAWSCMGSEAAWHEDKKAALEAALAYLDVWGRAVPEIVLQRE